MSILLTQPISGNLNLTGSIAVTSGQRVYLDGGSNTYIHEPASDRIDFVTSGSTRVILSTGTFALQTGIGFEIQPTQRVYLDGGSDTYLTEISGNNIQAVAGGIEQLKLAPSAVWLGGISGSTISNSPITFLNGGQTVVYNKVTVLRDAPSPALDMVRVRGTITSMSAVQNADTLGVLRWGGSWNDTSASYQATIQTNTVGVWSASGRGTQMYFYTTPTASTTQGQALLLEHDQSAYFGNHLAISATKKLFLDGGADTYIYESAANTINHVVSGTQRLTIDNAVRVKAGSLTVDPTYRIYLDGGSDTYIYESVGNTISFVSSNQETVTITSGSGMVLTGAPIRLTGAGSKIAVGLDNNDYPQLPNGYVAIGMNSYFAVGLSGGVIKGMIGYDSAAGAILIDVNTTTGGTRVVNKLLPSSDNTYDLGSGSLQWRNLYVSDTVKIGNQTALSTAGTGFGAPHIPGRATGNIANNGTFVVSTAELNGYMFIFGNGNEHAILLIMGSGNAPRIIEDTDSTFSTSSGTASKVNIYWSGTNLTIENKRGSARTFNIVFITG